MATDPALGRLTPALRIPGNTRASIAPTWTFTVLWNLVSAPILVYIPPELDRNPLAAVGFLFPLVGVGLLGWAVMTTLRWRRFGHTWLETTTHSAAPGGRLTGTMHIRLDPPSGSEPLTVLVKLTCLRRTITRRSDDSDSRENIVWREEEEVSAQRIVFGTGDAAIPVRFSIPADALETTAVGKSSGIFWVLSAEAQIPGVNLKEDFDIPVAKAGNTAIEPQPASSPTVPVAHPVTLDSLARSGIIVQPTDAGTAYHFSAMRNLSFAAGMTVFILIWTGGLWLQWRVGFPWIFLLICGLIELLLIVIAVDLWFGATTVTIGSGIVRRRHTVLGVGSTREIALGDISQIDLPITMQTTGRSGTPYYELRALRKNGRKLSLGSGIRNKRQAEWLAAEMRAALGLPALR